MNSLSFLPFGVLAALLSFSSTANGEPENHSKNTSATDKYRVVWTSDPSTTATIAWNQKSGSPGSVNWGTTDHSRKASTYENHDAPDRVQIYDGMHNCFVRLTGLEPDTEYFFCIEDDSGISPRFKFRTASVQPKPFTFISGGDSRNFRDVRILANQYCERLRPLFIAFTGDMINKDVAEEWVEWLDDWQYTISKDGHIIPIVPHRGNHERRPETIHNYFDTNADAYFSFDIGGSLFRYYVLNSEIPAIGKQEDWLEKDLDEHAQKITHLVAGYHKPMRPHVSAKAEGENPMQWADNFYKHGVDLALESDSHVMKRTHPLKPDAAGTEGFSAAPEDPKATVYIGEGCWGAPLRAADDGKPWTLDCKSFNGFDWISVSPIAMKVKTVVVEGHAKVPAVDPAKPFSEPEGIKLWQAKGGTILTVPADL